MFRRYVVLGLVVLAFCVFPLAARSQQLITRTAFQIVNLNVDEEAGLEVYFYDLQGEIIYEFTDTIAPGKSQTYIQGNMDPLAPSFTGSVVVASSQDIAAIANQNTSDADPATEGYNGSYTGFSSGSPLVYVPIVLNNFYGYYTEISVQNISDDFVDVFVNYDTTGCKDQRTNLPKGTAVRFNNTSSCEGGLNLNGSAIITATGDIVAIVNQVNKIAKLEQTYNAFLPDAGSSVLYAPIMLRAYYGFNSACQVQNISEAPMDIVVTYSDGFVVTAPNVLPGQTASFLQGNEDYHGTTWTGSAVITNTTGGKMVGIVNQQGVQSGASFNMYTSGATRWGLPSLLRQYYGFTSAFQVQNVSDKPVDIWVQYDDALQAFAQNVLPGKIAPPFIQENEIGHGIKWAGSAIVTATGPVVVVVNQDALITGMIDYQYSYNPIPLE